MVMSSTLAASHGSHQYRHHEFKVRKISDLQKWRRGWDSNPRYGFPYARFRGEYFQPLSHLSAAVAISLSERLPQRLRRLQSKRARPNQISSGNPTAARQRRTGEGQWLLSPTRLAL